MKLRTKLLLGVGILLFTMLLITFILPTFFIRKDVSDAASEVHALLIEDQERLLNSQKMWLNNTLKATKQNNDALLLTIYEEPLHELSPFFLEKGVTDVWMGLAKVAGYDQTIGFLQAHAPSQNKVAALLPQSTHLYPIAHSVKEDQKMQLTLIEKNNEQHDYLAVRLPDSLQTVKDTLFYLLIPPNASEADRHIVEQEITRIASTKHTQRIEFNKIGPQAQNTPWMIKMGMIRVLALFFSLTNERGDQSMAIGVARMDGTGNGYAILSQEVFSTQLLFDDTQFYNLHQPPPSATPLATASPIITLPQDHSAYIGNILHNQGSFLTIGAPLRDLAQQMALSSNKVILIYINHGMWLGFEPDGTKIEEQKLSQMTSTLDPLEKAGVINIAKQAYIYRQISSLEDGNLIFFDISPTEGERSIVGTLLSLEEKLSRRISVQLFLISLGIILLVLIFVGRIGLTVVHPITKLADATQAVMAGRYEEVILPETGERKDEVAILTRSFAEMVAGLQEREKIRGVLDKVVSKDVADEILRTQIHLGGEDRIVTILFSDIRGFSQLTTAASPQKTIGELNACMTKVSRVIEGEGGVIDKYVGDAVMAIYGAPTTHPDHALRAISSGILIIETLKAWNQQRAASREPLIEMGIGIHTGLVVAGNMGSEDRLNYTVLGANVNLAERLCEMAKPNQLLISSATLAQPNIVSSFYVKELQPITVKGFSEPIEVYEVLSFKWDSA